MAKGLIKTKKSTFETWLKGCGITETQLSKEMEIEQGNFSKMLNNALEPSKTFIKNAMFRTGYGFDALFEFDREAVSDDKGGE